MLMTNVSRVAICYQSSDISSHATPDVDQGLLRLIGNFSKYLAILEMSVNPRLCK